MMQELRLTYSDDGGEERSATVYGESFIVGRHSSCDLSIPDGRLSREHLKIERFDGEYFASDLRSSNGSALNGEELSGPVKLHDGDFLVLGGGVEITVRFEDAVRIATVIESPGGADVVYEPPPPPDDAVPSNPIAPVVSPARNSSVPASIFFVAPILGLLVLSVVGALIYLTRDSEKPRITSNEFQYSTDDIEPKNNKRDRDKPDPSNSAIVNTGDSISPIDANAEPTQTPSGEFAKIEINGATFLRRIATNDSRAFLTGEQAKRVSAKVKQFSGSPALSSNIESARKGSSQIRSIAEAKNLKPQFLAVAAMAKLGSNRGDVVQTAAAMADVLDKLGTHIGSELADDSLLMIAAYDQGAAGEFLKMRNQLQELANKYPESSRQIRSIWFLKEKGQITDAEFERALSFLAIGVITQNPKEFGVNAEPLAL